MTMAVDISEATVKTTGRSSPRSPFWRGPLESHLHQRRSHRENHGPDPGDSHSAALDAAFAFGNGREVRDQPVSKAAHAKSRDAFLRARV